LPLESVHKQRVQAAGLWLMMMLRRCRTLVQRLCCAECGVDGTSTTARRLLGSLQKGGGVVS
jgi:hypothetical protein